ncbi:hypothetical protein [Lentzea sp. NPDC055074]
MTLTRRAEIFLNVHGHRQYPLGEEVRETEADRRGEYQQRWGGLVLPPALEYDGGPRRLEAGLSQEGPGGQWFEAGPVRTALPYTFLIGPKGEFGVEDDVLVVLHESVEGWVEALALTNHAVPLATRITKVVGEDVDLDGYEPLPEVRGAADTWWRRGDTLVAVHTGEARLFDAPHLRVTRIFEGISWGI